MAVGSPMQWWMRRGPPYAGLTAIRGSRTAAGTCYWRGKEKPPSLEVEVAQRPEAAAAWELLCLVYARSGKPREAEAKAGWLSGVRSFGSGVF